MALLLLLLIAVLHIPGVQTRITKFAIAKVGNSIDGTIEVGSSSLNIYQGIELKEILVKTSSGELFLKAEKISLSPKSTLLALLTDGLTLNDLVLSETVVKLTREEEQDWNWQKLFGFREDSKEEEKRPVDISLSSIRLKNTRILYEDHHECKYADGAFKSVEIDLDQFSTAHLDQIEVSRVLILEPELAILDHSDVSKVINETTETEGEQNSGFPSLAVDEFLLVDGHGVIESSRSKPLRFDDLDLDLSDLELSDLENWTLRLNNFSLDVDNTRLTHLSLREVSRIDQRVDLHNLLMNLNESSLQVRQSSILLPSELSDLFIEIEADPSKLYLRDLFRFIPSLESEFRNDELSRKEIQLDGRFIVRGSQYEGKDISLWLDGKHHFQGSVLFDQDEIFSRSQLNANVTSFKSDVEALSKLSNKFVIPKDLSRLGIVNFSGLFDGYLNDFVANGLLESPLGDALLDIKFDFSGEGDEAILYGGTLSLDSFDLKSMTLNEDFGIISAEIEIQNGQGEDLSSSAADISAAIEKFEFKGYVYEDATYSGRLSSRVIDGKFEISDDELDFTFEGIADFRGQLPEFDFRVMANKINFCQLNLTDFPCEVSFASDVNIRGNSIGNVDGTALIGDILLKQDSTVLSMDNIYIVSDPGDASNHFRLQSDFVDIVVDGKFNLLRAFNHSVDQIIRNVIGHNKVWNYSLKDQEEGKDDNYNYRINLKEATPLFKFLGQNIEQTGTAFILGSHNAQENSVSFATTIPYISYGDFAAESISLRLNSVNNIADIHTQIKSVYRGGNKIAEVDLKSVFRNDRADWSIAYVLDQYNSANISAVSQVGPGGYYTTIKDNKVVIDSVMWEIISSDGIGIFKDKIDITDLTLSDGERYISFSDINQKGLQIALNDFALDFINPIINYDKTYFSGTTDGTIIIDNIFEDIQALYGFIEVPDFTINGDPFGSLLIKAQRNDKNDNLVDLNLSIEKDTQNLYALANYDIQNSLLDSKIEIQDYPMNFFEYIIDDGISETVGTTDIEVEISGPISDLRMSGGGIVKNAGLKIDYIGAYYKIEDQTVTLNETFIDFTNVELIDELDNVAVITGGLRHNLLADIRADLEIESPRFMALNTTFDDNPIYYGTGVGDLEVSFQGPFDAIDIVVNGTLEDLSKLSIPLTTTSYVYDESFIVFENSVDTVEEDGESIAEILKDKGVDFEMNLTFTPDAIVSIIYDEATSNVLEGTGEGNIKLEVKRDGTFNAYGNYNITTGRYLYTAYGFIAKPFIIRNGGTVIWTGDPLNATLNVTADHQGLRAPLTNFLGEYIGTSGISESDLSFSQDVDLRLLLSGTLFDPSVNFDIDFPNITGQLRTLAENKVRTLRSTENGLNNQVVGLLLFRNFLPDNNGLAAVPGGTVGASTNNTITQFLTSQLSLMASEYLNSKLGDGDFIKAIDLEIAVAQNSSLLGEDDGVIDGFLDVVPDEVQLKLRNQFKNENFVLNLGGNYVRENQLFQADNYVTGDFSLDWYLTDDRRLKMRFYGNYDYDVAFNTRRQRYGFGINFRKEFGTLTNSGFQEVLDRMIDEIKEDNPVTSGN